MDLLSDYNMFCISGVPEIHFLFIPMNVQYLHMILYRRLHVKDGEQSLFFSHFDDYPRSSLDGLLGDEQAHSLENLRFEKYVNQFLLVRVGVASFVNLVGCCCVVVHSTVPLMYCILRFKSQRSDSLAR